MPTISELPAIDVLSKLDLFEVTKNSELKSYSVTANDIANFVKNISNGGFKGSTTKGLDEFTIYDVGMWWWVNGSANPTGLNSGVVEIIAAAGPDDDNIEATFIQRLSFAEKVYQRMYVNGAYSGWGSLSNKNGAKIEYGVSTSTAVSFSNPFTSAPAVVAVPFNNATMSRILVINVTTVSSTGFEVQKLSSDLDVVTTTVTEVTDGNRTTTRTEQIRGAWTAANDIPFYWIALSDVGG